MPPVIPCTEVEAVQIVTLSNEGYKQNQIAIRLRKSQSAVSKILKRYTETGNYRRRPGQGRKRCTTVVDDRFLILSSTRNRTLTSTHLRNELLNVRQVNVSSKTVRRRLKEAGLNPRRPAIVPRLLQIHRTRRLEFARTHIHRNIEHWKNILFTDETRIQLWKPDGRNHVYRRVGERYATCNLIQSVSFGGGGIMLWGGISWDGRTELAEVIGGMTGVLYIENILQNHVLPYVGHIGYDRFILMHDNARPHAAGIVNDYLDDVQIERLDWPPYSPDPNPIEHLWDQLKRNIRRRNPVPSTIGELRIAAQEEWNAIPQENIQTLISSMPRRMQAVVRARGGNTRY